MMAPALVGNGKNAAQNFFSVLVNKNGFFNGLFEAAHMQARQLLIRFYGGKILAQGGVVRAVGDIARV